MRSDGLDARVAQMLDDGDETRAFHRMLYVFISPRGSRLAERGAVRAIGGRVAARRAAGWGRGAACAGGPAGQSGGRPAMPPAGRPQASGRAGRPALLWNHNIVKQ